MRTRIQALDLRCIYKGSSILLMLLAGWMLVAVPQSAAQIVAKDWEIFDVQRMDLAERVPICNMPVVDFASNTRVPAREREGLPMMKQELDQQATAQFETEFVNEGPSPQQAREAFEYATDIWSTHIISPVSIRVHVEWDDSLEGRTLGGARIGTLFYLSYIDEDGEEETSLFKSALASALVEEDLLEQDEAHIEMVLNPDVNWHFGVGEPGANQIDFISIVMHELGHGLGFSGSMNIEDGEGLWPFEEEFLGEPPMIYDRFTEDEAGRRLTNTDEYPNPSQELARALRGQRGGVYFGGRSAIRGFDAQRPPLYAPDEWNLGQSYVHVDEDTFPAGDENSLMTPFIAREEVIHSPGSITCGMFADMGWNLGPDCTQLLALPIVAIEAEDVDDGAEVTWVMDAEAPVEQFLVERRFVDGPPGTGEFQQEMVVQPEDYSSRDENFITYSVQISDLEVGRHDFRVRVTEPDGTVYYSPEARAHIQLRDRDFVVTNVYPNPVNQRARVDVTVAAEQDVIIRVFDVMGQQVQAYLQRPSASEPTPFEIDASRLSSGSYYVMIFGETFEVTRPFVVVR